MSATPGCHSKPVTSKGGIVSINPNDMTYDVLSGFDRERGLLRIWWMGDEDKSYPEAIYMTGKWDSIDIKSNAIVFQIPAGEMQAILEDLHSRMQCKPPPKDYDAYAVDLLSGSFKWYVLLETKKESVELLNILKKRVPPAKRQGFEIIAAKIKALILFERKNQ